MKPIILGLNIDHMATLKQARRSSYPHMAEFALFAQKCGVDQITAHLREDRRHMQDKDIFAIKDAINIPFNLEISLNPEIVDIALQLKPEYICLVPEKREEITTEGGLDVEKNFTKLETIIPLFKNNQTSITLFVDPHPKQIDFALKLGVQNIEINTGTYSNFAPQSQELTKELEKITTAAQYANQKGLNVHAGHGLTFANLNPILQIPQIVELNIGHFLIVDSVFYGLEKTIAKLKKQIKDNGR